MLRKLFIPTEDDENSLLSFLLELLLFLGGFVVLTVGFVCFFMSRSLIQPEFIFVDDVKKTST